MVLEVFAALSLASNIVQFVDFGGRLFFNAREIHHSKDGVIQEYRDIEAASKRITILAEDLVTSVKPVSNDPHRSDHEDKLIKLAQDCKDLADEVSKLLKRINDDKHLRSIGKFQSVLKAIRIAWNESDVKRMRQKLEELQSQVTVCLLGILRDNHSNILEALRKLSEQSLQLDKRVEDVTNAKTELFVKLHELSDSMRTSQGMSTTLDSIASNLSEWATKGNQLGAEIRVLNSLQFRTMTVRHAQISEAHKTTFEWAFSPQDEQKLPSTNHTTFPGWLRSGQGQYWITGKPGSGKSTLMKFLYDDYRTKSELMAWSQKKDVVTASFFFWNSGTRMQKSILGLLQTLLFETLRKCPELMRTVVPNRLDEHYVFGSESVPWSQSELKEAFRCISKSELPVKFCFFIDGMDEYDGDHADLISVLQMFTKSNYVKACVSSRPWNVFQDHFGFSNQMLLLEELTKADIQVYVRDALESSPLFQRTTESDTKHSEIITEIVQKADGVFLWVYLIVRSIQRGLTNCDTLSELQRRIKLLPSKLEDYFLDTLVSTDETYSERAAETFAVALRAVMPLSLMTYSYLDEEDPDFGLKAGIRPLSHQEALYRLRRMKRRLNARCNGLLEITIYYNKNKNTHGHLRRVIDDVWATSAEVGEFSTSQLIKIYKVEFIHRTVRDFLCTPDIRALIRQRILRDDFEPLSAICRAFLAQIKGLPMDFAKEYLENLSNSTNELLRYARASDEQYERSEARMLDELERTAACLQREWESNRFLDLINEHREGSSFYSNIAFEFWECLVRHGLCQYVSRRLRFTATSFSQPKIENLLAAALIPRSSQMPWFYRPEMVKILVEKSVRERSPEWTVNVLPNIWSAFLESIPSTWQHNPRIAEKASLLQCIRMILDIGANPNIRENKAGSPLLWETTLDRLTPILGADQRVVARSRDLMESYKNIFLAAGAQQQTLTETKSNRVLH